MRFRSSPHVDLRRLDELPADQRAAFRDLEGDPDFHSLLVPRPPLTTNIKAVPRQIANLFVALRQPSPLDGLSDEIVDLVLDGILEVERDGVFVSGADALSLFWSAEATPPLSDPRAIQRATAPPPHSISSDALLYAQDLVTADPGPLTHALYNFNRIPLSPRWQTSFANADAILAHLGAQELSRDWTRSRRRKGWIVWSSGPRPPRGETDVTYKMYVSARPERLREVFATVVRVLGGFPRARFKISDSAAGLLRPDKLVAYFETREALHAAADLLRRELSGCEAQGVPFTASLDDGGLLSWGVDPPTADRVLRWRDAESWRYWIAQRLGGALAMAKSARTASAVEPWRFALERLRRQGVDVDTWTPSAALWGAA